MSKKYKCLIIEDEPIAAEILQDYIKQVPFLHLAATCGDALFAMEQLHAQPIDLIFLDIHLPKLKGLDFLATLKNPPQVIITSAYHEYALQGYEHNVLDYLLKPIRFNRFMMAVNKLNNAPTAAPKEAHAQEENPSLFFTSERKRVKVYLHDILYIESVREYIRIYMAGRMLTTKLPISEVEKMLPAKKFIRIHRSFIIAKDKVEAFTTTDVEIADKQIPIGKSYKEEVVSRLEK